VNGRSSAPPVLKGQVHLLPGLPTAKKFSQCMLYGIDIRKKPENNVDDIMGNLISARQIRAVSQISANKEQAYGIFIEIATQLPAPSFRYGHP
jgi:hypothetical protein